MGKLISRREIYDNCRIAYIKKGRRGERRRWVKRLTDDVEEGEHLAEVVPVRPPVVEAQILPEIVQQHLLLLLLLDLGAEPNVEVHHESVNLATLPALPQPARRVEEDRLQNIRPTFFHCDF